tara:strand:- start:13287 stop:13388 length:102 start_codon:yes stop_codon:yes gene_type:complete
MQDYYEELMEESVSRSSDIFFDDDSDQDDGEEL